MNDINELISDRSYVPQLFVFGLNHNSASLSVREQLSFSAQDIALNLQNLHHDFPDAEFLLLSTCNRTEWYVCIKDQSLDLKYWLIEKKLASRKLLENSTYYYQNQDAVRHLYRVACGLDSMILGEAQILGQIKSAYQIAKSNQTIHTNLEKLLQSVFALVKQIRNVTSIGKNPVSAVSASIKLIEQFFDDFQHRRALIIGAGETGQLVAKYLHSLKLGRIIVANRNFERAQNLAEQIAAYAISMNQIKEHIHEVDIIFGASQNGDILISKEDIEQSIKLRRGKIQVLVDLSVPRIFDNSIDRIDNAFLYAIDDLADILEDNLAQRRQAAEQAEIVVNLYSNDFHNWLQSKKQREVIRKFRNNSENIKKNSLKIALEQLKQGKNPQEVLENFSHQLSQKLLHVPSSILHALPANNLDLWAIIADSIENNREYKKNRN